MNIQKILKINLFKDTFILSFMPINLINNKT